MLRKEDKYNSENIKTVADLSVVYKNLDTESLKLWFVLELKKEELKKNSEKTDEKLARDPRSDKSSWVLDPTKKKDIREPGSTANLEAMKQEWDNAMKTFESLDKSIKEIIEQNGRLNDLLLETARLADLKTTDTPLSSLIVEVNKSENAIEEFKKTYVAAWGNTDLEEKLKISSPIITRKIKKEEAKKEQADQKEREKLFAEAFYIHEKSRFARTDSQINFQEAESVLIHGFAEKIAKYVGSTGLFGQHRTHISEGIKINNFLLENDPRTITQELINFIKQNTPEKGMLNGIITQFMKEAEEKGYLRARGLTQEDMRHRGPG